jgi:hypothetical protein
MSGQDQNYTTPQNQNKRKRSSSVSSLSTDNSDVPTLVDSPYLSPVPSSLSRTPATVATVTSQMSPGQQEALGLQHDTYTAYHTLYKKIHLEDMNIMIANQNDKRIYPNLFVFDEMDNNDKNAAKDGSIQAYRLNTNTDTFYPVSWDPNNNKFVSQDNLDLNQSTNSFYSSNNLSSLMAMEDNPTVVTSDSSTGSYSYFGHKGGKRKLRRTSKKGKKRNAGSGKGTQRKSYPKTSAQRFFSMSEETRKTLPRFSNSAYAYSLKKMEDAPNDYPPLPNSVDRISANSPLPILTEPIHDSRSSSPYPDDTKPKFGTKPKNGGKRKSKKNIKRRNKKTRRKP